MSVIENRSIRLFTVLLVGLAIGFAGVATASAEVKIGYVDLYRALESVDEGQRIRQQLEREFQRRQQQLDDKQQEVMELHQQLEQQAMMLSDDARQQKAVELQQKMGELQQLYLTLQQELAQQEAQAMRGVFEQMRDVVQQIGREGGYTMILERTETSILYSVDGLDLTDQLIRRFNARD
jgi:outer membrane protein